MITDTAQSRAASSLGWADQGSLWVYDTAASAAETVPVSDARYLDLIPGAGDLFSVVHHYDGSHAAVTVHAFDSPAAALARIEIGASRAEATGDHAVWDLVPSAYVAALSRPGGSYHLIRVTRHDTDITPLGWFNDDSWDHGYQGVTAVAEIPGTSELLFSVARCSDLILCDPAGQEIRRRIPLAGAHGNPIPHLSRHSPVLWAVDYDTATRVDRATWQVTSRTRLQDAISGTRMFAGNLWVSPDETTLLVPRPGSGDILSLQPRTMEVTQRIPTGGQPLDAARMSTGDIVARDWKTGTLLTAANQDRRWRPRWRR